MKLTKNKLILIKCGKKRKTRHPLVKKMWPSRFSLLDIPTQMFSGMSRARWLAAMERGREVELANQSAEGRHVGGSRQKDGICIVKIRMASFSVKRSPFRVIYACFQEEEPADFIQIYFKGNHKREDTKRWNQYIDKLKSLC